MVWMTWWPLVSASRSPVWSRASCRATACAASSARQPTTVAKRLDAGRHLLVVQLRRQRDGPRALRARGVVDELDDLHGRLDQPGDRTGRRALYLLLGWQFVVAQIVGGAIMIGAVRIHDALSSRAATRTNLRERVRRDSPRHRRCGVDPGGANAHATARTTARRAASRIGDLTMLRKELLAGFLVAGFLMADVPNRWWSHLFLSGHGDLDGHRERRSWRRCSPSSPSSVRSATSRSRPRCGPRRRLRRRGQLHLRRPRDVAAAAHLPPLLRHLGRALRLFALLWLVMSVRRTRHRPALRTWRPGAAHAPRAFRRCGSLPVGLDPRA
jgi:hypothetical protein